jgi:hypothetical protein
LDQPLVINPEPQVSLMFMASLREKPLSGVNGANGRSGRGSMDLHAMKRGQSQKTGGGRPDVAGHRQPQQLGDGVAAGDCSARVNTGVKARQMMSLARTAERAALVSTPTSRKKRG